MEKRLVYAFPDHRFANRFLADVQSGTIERCRAKRDSSELKIAVTLLPLPTKRSESLANEVFDDRSQALDDLAESYEGAESH